MRPTRAELIVLTITFLSLAVFVIFPIRSFDLFWHIANGKAMVEQGRIVQEDLFSYTEAGTHFSNHWWLSQIILYLIYHISGTTGLILFKTVLSLAIAWTFYLAARMLDGDRVVTALLLLVAFIAGWWRYMVRPQLFSFLFVGVTAYLLFGTREGKLAHKYLFFLVPLFVLWDFFHGALYGLILLGAFTAGETLKVLAASLMKKNTETRSLFFKTLWIAVVCVIIAMLISPFGLRSYSIFGSLFKNKVTSFALTGEFRPPRLDQFHTFWILLGVACVSTIVSSFRKFDITNIFVLIPFTAMALKYNRAIGIFALVCIPILAVQYQAILSYTNSNLIKKVCRAALLVLMAACLVFMVKFKFFLPGNHYAFGFGLNEDKLPVAAARFVKGADIKGKMFNFDFYGGYFSYFLYPERKIYMFNLPEVFTREQLESMNTGFLNQLGISYCIVEPSYTWTRIAMMGNPQWHLVFWDSAAAVFVREGALNNDVIQRYELKYLTPELNMKYLSTMAAELPPKELFRLAREISNELRFAHDLGLADFLGELMMNRKDVFQPEARHRLARSAMEQNSESPRLQEALSPEKPVTSFH